MLDTIVKNIYKLINHHIAIIGAMHLHWMILLNYNIAKAKRKYHIAPDFFFQYPPYTNA